MASRRKRRLLPLLGPMASCGYHRTQATATLKRMRVQSICARLLLSLSLKVSPPRRLRDGTVTWQRGRQAQCPPPHRLMHGRRRHGEMRELINVGRPPWAIANDYLGGP